MTFAAVICDADDPCSVNTAYDPVSSFTISPRNTTRPLYFGVLSPIQHFSDDRCPLMTQNELQHDPHILERWGYAHEVHLDKCNRARDFGLEFWYDVQ